MQFDERNTTKNAKFGVEINTHTIGEKNNEKEEKRKSSKGDWAKPCGTLA